METKEYLSWNKTLEIEKYTPLRSFLHIEGETQKFYINNSATDIITGFDGSRTYDEVIHDLAEYYKDEESNIIEVVEDYRKIMAAEYNVKLVGSTEKKENKCRVYGDVSYYPKVASIEITEKCNVKCLHCYGEFCPSLKKEMPFEKLKQLLLDLSNVGVQVIELTGGDISVYTKLMDVVKYALTLPFMQIDLLTNGVALSKPFLDLIIENKDRLFVQIDIHSMKDEYLEWFMQTKVSAERIRNTVALLANNGVRMRAATVFTEKNIDEFFDIAEYVNSLGIVWGVTPVEPLGRADFSKVAPGLYLSVESTMKLQKNLETALEKYPGLLRIPKDSERANEYNCGVLSEHVVINTLGDIKLCTMDNLSYCKSSIGNVFDDNIAKIYDDNVDFIYALSTQDTPDENSAECKDCENRYLCAKCLLRTFINVQKKDFKCEWYKNRISQVIKKRCFE